MRERVDKIVVACIMVIFFILFVLAGYGELKGWVHTP